MAFDRAGVLQKFNTHAGSLSEATLIGPFQVVDGNSIRLDDIGATMEPTGVAGKFTLQKADDEAFSQNVKNLSRISMPRAGTAQRTFEAPLPIDGPCWVRVRFIQGTADEVSCELHGKTTTASIVD